LAAPLTVDGALFLARRDLRNAGPGAPLDALRLLEFALDRAPGWMLAHGDAVIASDAAERFAAALARRARGEPLAYVFGSAGFYGREFEVTPEVLVPRPETEHLVEGALADVRARFARGARSVRICDVGTGSGAIAITVALELPEAFVVASDVSAAALAVARRNAVRLAPNAALTFVCGDLGEPLRARAPYDCIVANLPYVPSAALPERPDPAGFEPRLALDGGADGLALYRRLLGDLPALAAPGAAAYLEAAPPTIEPLAALVARMLPNAHVEIGEDYAGLERYVAVSL
jgi:release factor glutamine methyltransferase